MLKLIKQSHNLAFICILDLKQQNNILGVFTVTIENVLFSNKLFSCPILQSKGIIYRAKKIEIKYFVEN